MNNLTCYCYNYKCIVDCNNNNWSCNNNNICERNDFEYSFFNMFLLLGVFLISILSSIAGIGGGALLISFFNILVENIILELLGQDTDRSWHRVLKENYYYDLKKDKYSPSILKSQSRWSSSPE